MISHTAIKLPAYTRGYHLITDKVIEALGALPENGILHLFIQHTSASLTINENADPSVRRDFERHINHLCPENAPYYEHTYEGPDDMPAHLKASLLGASVSIPIINGRLGLGTWQGVYLGEHRDHGGSRTIIASVYQ